MSFFVIHVKKPATLIQVVGRWVLFLPSRKECQEDLTEQDQSMQKVKSSFVAKGTTIMYITNESNPFDILLLPPYRPVYYRPGHDYFYNL